VRRSLAARTRRDHDNRRHGFIAVAFFHDNGEVDSDGYFDAGEIATRLDRRQRSEQ